MKKEQPKFFTICASAMIATATYIFSVAIGLPYIFMIAAFILSLSILIPYRIKYNDRSVIYSIVISLTMAVFLDLFFPMDRDKFMLVGELVFINISAPFLVYFCALITFFEFTPHLPGLISAISSVLILMTSDVQKGGDTASKLPFFSFAPRTYDTLFFAIVILEILLLVAVISFARPLPLRKLKPKISFAKIAITAVALLVSGSLLFLSIRFFGLIESSVRNVEDFFVRYGFRGMRRGASYMSSRTIDLRRPMSEQLRESREKIILRAESKFAPGYLRGRVFENYTGGNWLPAQRENRKLPSKSYEGILVYRTFFTGKKEMYYPEKINFLFSGDFKTDILLMPGNYEQIDIVADKLGWNLNGVLYPEEWEKDGGYTVYSKSIEPYAAYASPAPLEDSEAQSYLAVPEEISVLLDNEIQQIFDGTDMSKFSDREKIEQIRYYLLSNYKYSLDFSMRPEDKDPLESFFRRKRAHCELFATAAAMITRRLGIPARYVTGFLCFEQSPTGKYYVSRVENAHAWTEVYLQDEEKWIMLEATPDDAIPRSASNDWNFMKVYMDYFYKTMQNVLSDVRRGFFAKAVLTFLISFFEVCREIIWHPLRGPLIAIAALLIFLLKLISTRRKLKSVWKLTENTFRLAQEFKRFEKKLSSITKIHRENSSTINEWLAKIADKYPERSNDLKEFSEVYQIYRFGNGSPPSQNEIQRIRKIINTFSYRQMKR